MTYESKTACLIIELPWILEIHATQVIIASLISPKCFCSAQHIAETTIMERQSATSLVGVVCSEVAMYSNRYFNHNYS